MEFDEARKCVEHLVDKSAESEDLHKNISIFVTSLSTIIQIAGYAEQLVKRDARFGNFSLGIYASAMSPVQTTRENAASEKRNSFTLFGPKLESRNERREEEEDNTVETSIREDKASFLTEALRTDTDDRIQHHLSEQPVNRGEPKSDQVRDPSVPESIVAKCMSYIFDCSGHTTHPSSFTVKNMDSLNAKSAVKAVKELFKKYKEVMKQRGINTHGMQYVSMIPEHLRNKDIFLPNLALRRSRNGDVSYRKEGVLKVKMPIHKADRNKKTENIAVMACFLHHNEHGVAVEDVMSSFARQGLGAEGCKAFKKCSAARLMIPCRDKASSNCIFYGNRNGEKIVVAKGSVDPFATYICGQEIPESSILVRISCVQEPQLLDEREGIQEDELKLLPRVWPKHDISRVQILGEHGNENILGDGIIVMKDLVSSDGGVVDSMSICNAILFCDCNSRPDKHEEPYPFSEWYTNRLFRQMTEFLGPIPQNMGDTIKGDRKVMIWHKARIRCTD